MKRFRVNSDFSTLHSSVVLLNNFLAERYYILTFVVVNQIQVLKRGYYVFFFNTRQFTDFTENAALNALSWIRTLRRT